MKYKFRVCSFTALDDLPRKLHGDYQSVKKALIKAVKFSVFEATANTDIANTMTRLAKDKSLIFKDLGYPWTSVTPAP